MKIKSSRLMAQPVISKLIVGVDDLIQSRAVLRSTYNKNHEFFDDLTSLDPNLLNPSNWRFL